MNSTHRVNVVKIDEILPHNRADTLGIVYIGGYQVVVKKDDFKIGDLAIYVQPDTIVPATEPFKFLWADREFADGTVPERLRRITVRRFRREWSEGLLMPVSSFPTLYNQDGYLCSYEGDDVAEELGFKHYEEPETIANIQGKRQLPKRPHSLRGWFFYILAKLHIYRTAVYGTDQTKPPEGNFALYTTWKASRITHVHLQRMKWWLSRRKSMAVTLATYSPAMTRRCTLGLTTTGSPKPLLASGVER